MTVRLTLLFSCALASAACAVDEHETATEPAAIVGVPEDLPTDAFRRVLWLIRAEALRGRDTSTLVQVHDTSVYWWSATLQDTIALPTTLRAAVEKERGFAVIPGSAKPCVGDIRVGLVGAAQTASGTYRLAIDYMDLRRPDMFIVLGQEYTVHCNSSYCSVTDVHLGDEPDIEVDFADEAVCSARR
jgi:hypothetical protein